VTASLRESPLALGDAEKITLGSLHPGETLYEDSPGKELLLRQYVFVS